MIHVGFLKNVRSTRAKDFVCMCFCQDDELNHDALFLFCLDDLMPDVELLYEISLALLKLVTNSLSLSYGKQKVFVT